MMIESNEMDTHLVVYTILSKLAENLMMKMTKVYVEKSTSPSGLPITIAVDCSLLSEKSIDDVSSSST